VSAARARRVVVTGVGLCSPIGNDVDTVIEALREQRSGVSRVEWPGVYGMKNQVGGVVTGVERRDFPRKKVRSMGRVGLLSAYASEQAVRDSGLSEDLLSTGRTGLTYGSTHGSSSELESYCRMLFAQNTLEGIPGSQYLKFMSHTAAANLAAFFNIRGRVQPTCSACTSGSQAIGLAFDYLRSGAQDVMICGGAEELHFVAAAVFEVMFAASTGYSEDPPSTPRPFDRNRDGVVIGEGAGTLVLETLEHAEARGARVYGEIIGYATNCDGIHLTSPSWEGMAACMAGGLESAGVEAGAVDYINAHGTATELGDIAESRATFEIMGGNTPISTQKSYTGHTLGACGAIETIFSLLMMREGFVAPNRSLEEVDPRCAALDYIVGEPMVLTPEVVMNNNFAFGGINTSLILART
jgi:3-oxoacyl-[acyl-carrier-protein] synthase II